MSEFVAVIMAGGQGQRFWPLSTAEKPKQFLDLEQCGRSLLQSTFDRLLPLTGGPERILIATGERYAALVKEQLPELPLDNLLIEPVGRDSAPAIALASLTVQERFGDAITGFFPSDHRIGDPAAFNATIRQTIGVARDGNGLVTIGISPTRPATGYGYIEQGDATGNSGFKVARFVEKPTLAKAEDYLASGRYLWNAGIFVWRSSVISQELARHAPELFSPLQEAVRNNQVDTVFPTLPKISIDYALMEKTDRAFVVPGSFDWDDIGDWVALERHLKASDGETNTVVGRHVGIETSGNIIYTENPDDIIITLGVEDLVVVKRGNTILLVRKDRVQDIKSLLADERLISLVVS
jgi:mannose-1-phosphate guanylyltransferase